MKISIRDFFKQGEFWSGLQTALDKISGTVKQQGAYISKLEERSNLLVTHIKYLQSENKEMKDRLNRLEQRLWELNVVSKTDGLVIVQAVEPDNVATPRALSSGHNPAVQGTLRDKAAQRP